MTARIVPLFGETMEAFVRRAGPVTTSAVGYRFGMDARDARAALKALERAGKVARGPILHKELTGGRGGGCVRQLVWRAPDPA